MTLTRRQHIALLASAAVPGLQNTAYAGQDNAMIINEIWTDAARQRDVPVKLRWPDPAQFSGPNPVLLPVVLFSHGLGGTTDGGEVWGRAWAAAGFVVVHLQHPGSDLAAVRSVTNTFTDKEALRKAASPAQLLARLHDVRFVLSEIGRRKAAGHVAGNVTSQVRWQDVRADRIGMSGHSFGAHTTLGIAGQRYLGFDGMQEPRLTSFIAFSPSLPVAGDAQDAFVRLTRPLLCITGTRDADVAGTGATPERRMAVYGAMPPGHKAHLVLRDADHMTFGGQTGRAAEIVPRVQATRDLQGAHHALVAAITTDWWRATLADDAVARERLVAPAGLGTGDVWQQG